MAVAQHHFVLIVHINNYCFAKPLILAFV